MPTIDQIEEILDRLDRSIGADPARPEWFRSRCKICTSEKRRELTRALLTNSRTWAEVGRDVDVARGSVDAHMQWCLVKRAGLVYPDFRSSKAKHDEPFPVNAKISSQKKWVLEQFLFLREEIISNAKKGKMDTRQLSKITRDIEKAANEFEVAKKREREMRRGKRGRPPTDQLDDLTAEQIREMNRVGKPQEVQSGQLPAGPNGAT